VPSTMGPEMASVTITMDAFGVDGFPEGRLRSAVAGLSVSWVRPQAGKVEPPGSAGRSAESRSQSARGVGGKTPFALT
jgi:hypothetical protein